MGRQGGGLGARRRRGDVLKYRLGGKYRWLILGRAAVLSVEAARNEARRLLGLVAARDDPAAARDARKAAPTMLPR